MGADDALFDPMNEFPYIQRRINDLSDGKPRTGKRASWWGLEVVCGTLRLGVVNAPSGYDVTDAQLLLCRVDILRPQMYQRNLNPCDAQMVGECHKLEGVRSI